MGQAGYLGKLEKSTFQRYKVCANQSSDGKVMAPESRGVQVVFLHFSGEPRVASRSRSCSLSQGSKLADQLAASWKESTPEGGCSRGKAHQIFSTFSLSSSVFARTVDEALDISFRRSWYRWKACDTFFLKVPDLHEGELGFVRCSPANRGCWSVFHAGGSFFDRDSGLTGEALDDPRVTRCS
uniref:Uncharacterized protein n=1 Tax=Fagus sylvatica TaxID=28930 RepID=A0A2N9I2M3_FAGSY